MTMPHLRMARALSFERTHHTPAGKSQSPSVPDRHCLSGIFKNSSGFSARGVNRAMNTAPLK